MNFVGNLENGVNGSRGQGAASRGSSLSGCAEVEAAVVSRVCVAVGAVSLVFFGPPSPIE
ncbi:hypothetical protein DY000_02013336 [Brassica cretica]|uniref:Uncharacterized protein n=1 Tax=Brassica cretica TaxID=69181 RepID=A0ABQ7CRP1_BRACR|nr:hypothetical protein DY000_02013336 [Brassica cretica]